MTSTTSTTSTTDQGEPRSTKWIVAWVTRAIVYLLYAYVVIVEIILLVGFLLKLFGASRASGFVDWWYRHLEDVMEPFSGIFGSIELGTTSNDVQAVFETSILFAMVIYGIVAIALHSLITWLSGVLHQIEARRLEAERRRAYEAALVKAQRPYDPMRPQPPTQQYPYPGTAASPGPTAAGAPAPGAQQPAPGAQPAPGQAPGQGLPPAPAAPDATDAPTSPGSTRESAPPPAWPPEQGSS